MKKIFASLLALVGMVAGLTLTSCGGGGGGGDDGVHKFAYKTIRFYGNGMNGSMLVEIQDKKNSQDYNAIVSFGENGSEYAGYLRVISNTEQPKITIQLEGDPDFEKDENVFAYFSDFLPEEKWEEGDSIFGFPRSEMTLTYNDDEKGGTYSAYYKFELIGDDPRTTEVEPAAHQYTIEKTLDNLIFHIVY